MRFSLYLQRLEDTKKLVWTIRVSVQLHPVAKRSKRVCIIAIRRPLGQSRHDGNLALLECHLALQMCHSALQKCRIGSWRLNALSCSGAIWFLLLGFLDRSLYLDAFSTSDYDFFFITFLDNSVFFKNNYLVDKSLKINLDSVQIIPNFVVIQSSILFLCMHPYFKY